MPIVKRPSHPVPKGPSPGSRKDPHRVKDKETWESVATAYGLSVQRLIRHNFRTLDPAEINWYLYEYVGCRKSPDQKNYCFSTTDDPGLVYLPPARLEMEPILITAPPPKAPNIPTDKPPEDKGQPLLPQVIKFAWETKTPVFEKGDFACLFKFALEGELSANSMTSFQVKGDAIKAAMEKQLTEDVSYSVGVKLEKVKLDDVAEAVKNKDLKGFLAKFAGLEGSLKGKLNVGPVNSWEAGAEFALRPIFVKIGGSCKEEYHVPELVIAKFSVKGSMHVGPSTAGWVKIWKRVGAEALKNFAKAGGESLAALWETLVAEGIVAGAGIAAGAIIGTLGITYLTASIVAEARRKGELEGIATWYGSAYLAKVFRRPRPSGFITGDVELRDQVLLAGEKDAIRQATEIVAKRNETAEYPTEEKALGRYRELALAMYGSEENAEFELRKVLNAHARKIVGL